VAHVWFWTFWHWSEENFRDGALLRGPLHGIGGHWDEWFRHEASDADRRAIARAGQSAGGQRRFIAWLARCWAREATWRGVRPPVRFVLAQLSQVPPFDSWSAFARYRTTYGAPGVSAVVLAEGSHGEPADVRAVEVLLLPHDADTAAPPIVTEGFAADPFGLDAARRAAAGLLGGPGIGYKQDYAASGYLKDKSPETYQRYASEEQNRFLFFPAISGLDGAKVGVLADQSDTPLERVSSRPGHTGLNQRVEDLALWLLGPISRVRCDVSTFTRERPTNGNGMATVDVDDAATCQLEFASGAVGVLNASGLCLGRANHQRVEVYGTKGGVIYEIDWPGDAGGDQLRVCFGAAQHRTVGMATAPTLPRHEATPLDPFLDFFQAIHDGREALVTFDDAVRVQEVLGLRDLSRTDLIVTPDGEPTFLEVNVSPGMTETSSVPLAIEAADWSLGGMCADLVRTAAARTSLAPTG